MTPAIAFFYIVWIAGGLFVAGVLFLVWFFLWNVLKGLLTDESA